MAKNLMKVLFTLVLSMVILSTTAFPGEKSTSFPKKPVRWIVPYAAGSGNDVQSRGIVPYVDKHLGVSVVIENRPGADSRIGLNEVWKSPADGYTVVNPGMPTPIINEKLFSVNYKTREFTHIFAWSQDNMVLVVNAETWKTPAEFVSAGRSGTLSCGLTGIGSVSQIAGLMLEEAANLKPVNWVPFSGGAETMTQLAGKHIDFGITTTSSARALVVAGKLKPLLIFSDSQDPTFPDAPLPKEIGLTLTAMPVVRGIMGPPGISPEIVRIFEQAFFKALKDPNFLAWAEKVRTPISAIDHEGFLAYTIAVEKEVSKYLDKIKIKK